MTRHSNGQNQKREINDFNNNIQYLIVLIQEVRFKRTGIKYFTMRGDYRIPSATAKGYPFLLRTTTPVSSRPH